MFNVVFSLRLKLQIYTFLFPHISLLIYEITNPHQDNLLASDINLNCRSIKNQAIIKFLYGDLFTRMLSFILGINVGLTIKSLD